jgi:putative transposase
MATPHADSSDDSIGALIARTGPYPPRGNYSRSTRLKRDFHGGATCFHVMSRTCGGDVFFDDVEKEALRRLLLRMTAFLGIELLTYCVMGNHFHALIRVPNQRDWAQQFEGEGGEETLLRHLGTFYSKAFMQRLRNDLRAWRSMSNEALAQRTLDGFKKRFCDLSVFMMELKVRFTRWFNKRHERKGTLWMGPFKSVLVQGTDDPLRTMAAYIDLNPVRAGYVKKPEDYRWCGYADALAGQRVAQEGICSIMQQKPSEWARAFGEEEHGVRARYRRLLYHHARLRVNHDGKVVRKGLTPAEAERVTYEERGKLDADSLIMHTVRHFSRGLAVGSKDWLEGMFEANRAHFGPKRKTGARRIDAAEALHALRQL